MQNQQDDVIFKASQINFEYDTSKFKLNNIEFMVYLNKISKLYGSNQSGKSTLLKVLTTTCAYDEGKLTSTYPVLKIIF